MALVCGAGGFIGSHLVKKLVNQGNYVCGVDLHYPEYSTTTANKFYIADLRNSLDVDNIVGQGYDEIYQLAADMGGAGYVFTGNNDANIMHNSVLINLNILNAVCKFSIPKIFYSSSACVYPEHNQLDPDNPMCVESTAYPAAPDSEYGWEKLFSERLYLAYARNHSVNVRIARFHNIFGPMGAWNNGREKAPAALCRKIALVNSSGTIEIWGPGNQTRSFLFIDECLEGIERLMTSDFTEPVNLGSERMISINNLAYLIAKLANKSVTINNVPGPIGVMGRTSDNRLMREKLNWAPQDDLEQGLKKTYNWIHQQLTLINTHE